MLFRSLEMLSRDDFRPRQMIDAEVEWDDLNMRLIGEVESLAPFGPANPEPTLLLRQVVLGGLRIVGTNHLKFLVGKPGNASGGMIDVIGFRMGERLAGLRDGAKVDLVFTPERNVWQGRERIQLRLKDLRPSEI